jgi:hypothetical protein
MAYNLARNSRVFVTTNLSTTVGATVASGQTNAPVGAVLRTGFSTENCWEIQVLDGFQFSQGTATTDISINEAGLIPTRGKRTFNTALNPVELSFSTYIRPRLASNIATAEERVLWNALVGAVGIDGTVQTGVTLGALVSTTTGTMTRASTTAAVVTLAALTMTAAPVAGSIYFIKGMTTAGTLPWYGPIKVTSFGSNTLIGEYLTAPPAAAGAASPSMAGLSMSLAAWNQLPTNTAVTASAAHLTTGMSNRNQLQPFGLMFLVDSTWYIIDNAAMDQAQIDFGLDAIAMIAWTGKATQLNSPTTQSAVSTAANPVFSGYMTGTATGKTVSANYITNKLSTLTLQSNLGGIAGTAYTVVLTGGSITIANNINYVTPNNIGTVNIPIGYYTGARSISGTLNAYLRTGTGQAADLLQSMLSSIGTSAETKYRLQVEIGGLTAGTRVELDMPGTVVGVPSVEVADVISTAITFSAQGTTPDLAGAASGYDLENTNDLTVRYYSL